MKQRSPLSRTLGCRICDDPLVRAAALCFAAIAVFYVLGCDGVRMVSLSVSPESCTFTTASDSQQLLVTGHYSDGNQEDLTSAGSGTTYQSGDETIATVTADGLVAPVKEGTTTVTASNTGLSASVNVTVDWQDPPQSSNTKIYGRVFDSSDDTPMPNADITVAGVAGLLATNADGRFAFPVPQAGTYDVTASRAGYTYAQRRVAIASGQFATVPDMYLTLLDTASITIGPEGGTGANSDGSIELVVPANALTESVSMRATWYDRGRELPNFLPELSHFTYACELTPDGQSFNTPVTVRMKNTRGFAPGTPIPVGIYDNQTLQWTHESMGIVNSDGQWVEYQVSHFSPRDCNLGRSSPDGSGEPGSARNITTGTRKMNQTCSTVGGGSQIGVADGHLSVDHVLPAYRTLDAVRTVALQYNSHLVDPTTIIGLDYDISQTSVLPPERICFRVEIGGQRIERFFIPMDGPMSFLYRWDGKDGMGQALPSGQYAYTLTLVNEY